MILRKTGLLFLAAVLIEIIFISLSWKMTYFSNQCLVISVDNLASAQVARNIIEGKGYKTDSLSLYEVALYDKKGWLSEGPPWKNTYRFPLPILSIAALFKVFGATHFVADFLYPSIFHLLSVTAVFALTYILFQNGIIAFIASFIFVTNDGLLSTMLSKNDSADIFFFTISLIAFLAWDRGQKIMPFVTGAVLGLSFLNRFNEGAILFFVYLIIIYFKKKLIVKEVLLYTLGFIIPILPFIFYNSVTLGTPFFSSNSYFQFIENSIVSKYMNVWYKLQYGIDVEKPLTYLLSYPADFFARSFMYIREYTLPGLFGFRRSFWWWIPLAVGLIQRPLDLKIKVLAMLFVITFILHIFLIAPLGLNIRYIQFLFVPLIIIVAKTVYEWYNTGIKFIPAFKVNPGMALAQRGGLKEIACLSLTACIVPLSLNGYDKLPMNVCIWIIGFTVVLVLTSVMKKRLILVALYSFLLLVFSSLIWMNSRYKMWDIEAYTAEDPAVLKKIEDTTGSDSIILTTHPWNTAWFSRRPSVPVPEYADEIYLLMKRYGLKINAIYFSHFDVFARHANFRVPISYHAYARLNEYVLPVRGFTQIQPLVKGGLLLYRDNDNLEDILNTDKIDFGGVDSNSHLVFGFSSPMTLYGSTVCWVLRDTGSIPFDKQKFRFFKDKKLVEYDMPNAEITFLRDGTKPMKGMSIRLYNFNPEEAMTMVMNSNLFSYGDKGLFVATVPLHKGWNSINVPFNDEICPRSGLNKLSFWFKEKSPLSSLTDKEVYLQYMQNKGMPQQLMGIAFNKMYFYIQ